MRLAALADIHGNLPALEAVLADVEQLGVDGTIVAGDFIDRPQPLEAVHAVRALGACTIRGNRENYALAYTRQEAPVHWRTSKQWTGIRWLCDCLDDETLDYIASLPEACVYAAEGTDPIRVVHGSPETMTGLVLPSRDRGAMELYRQAGLLELSYNRMSIDEAVTRFDEPVLVCAHSHIPWKQELHGTLAVNPGSVGVPINGDARAQYALLTWARDRWEAELRAIPYDLQQIRSAFEKSDILAIEGDLASALLRSIETGLNLFGMLMSHCRRCATEAGIPESEAIPDAVWDQAVAAFDWEAAAHGVRAKSSQE
jgi:predicted phosphodiesterase